MKEALAIINVFIRPVQKVKTQRKCAKNSVYFGTDCTFPTLWITDTRKYQMKSEIWIIVFQYPFQMCSKAACSTYSQLDRHSVVRTEKKKDY